MVLFASSQHEFVEKELTILLVLQLMYEYMYVLNPNIMHVNLYFCQFFNVKKESGNDSQEDLAT
jgi:hypothetical protein